jgi:hypothetical protein
MTRHHPEKDRLEVDMAWGTTAAVDREEARQQERLAERKRTLVEQLRLRFDPLPAETEQVIEGTQDPEKLAEWLRGVITARDFDSIGIVSRR